MQASTRASSSTSCYARSAASRTLPAMGWRSSALRSAGRARWKPTSGCKRCIPTSMPAGTWPGPTSSRTRRRTRRGTPQSMRSSAASENSAPTTRRSRGVERVRGEGTECSARGIGIRHRRARPGYRRRRGARHGEGADRSGQGPHPRRHPGRRARRRPDRGVHRRHEAWPRPEEDPRYHPYLSDARRGEQIRGRRVEKGARPRSAAAASRKTACMDARLIRLSVVVSALNEARGIAAALQALEPLRRRGHEVIVVDGGSADGTPQLARALCDRVIAAPRGRALQMNAGAREARGDALVFLHADTRLPALADEMILSSLRTRVWGRFDVQIDARHPLLKLVGCAMNLRSRLTGIATGDQAIFVRRDAFGGFPEIALMEDI